jgi:hypothetical protein
MERRRALRIPGRYRWAGSPKPDRGWLDNRTADRQRRSPSGPDVSNRGGPRVSDFCAEEGGGNDPPLEPGESSVDNSEESAGSSHYMAHNCSF